MSSNNFVVLYDSCVLYSAYLRDVLVTLAHKELFKAKWTHQINEEWIRNLLNNRPEIAEDKLKRTANEMNNLPDCIVSNYEDLIERLNLPDPNDRHILAAAIKSGSQVIVTYNLADFPEAELQKYNIEAQHPNEFIDNLINLSPQEVLGAVLEIKSRLRNPPKSINELIEIYKSRELHSLGDFLEAHKSKFS